jgi:hypothetical protein
MSSSTTNRVPFGNLYSYEHDTRRIVVHEKPERFVDVASFTTPAGNRREFSNSDLALKIFNDELEQSTFPIVQGLFPRWVAVQVVVPMVELIGKIQDARNLDGENFKAGARRVVPQDSINPTPTNAQYETILDTLWSALRCGVSHTGFMQDEKSKHIDVQVAESDLAPIISFADDPADPGYMVVEVGALAFVDAVIREVRAMMAKLSTDTNLRDQRFLRLWRRRWGSYPASAQQ